MKVKAKDVAGLLRVVAAVGVIVTFFTIGAQGVVAYVVALLLGVVIGVLRAMEIE